MAPQSPLEESATTSARWHRNGPSRRRMPGGTPFSSALFMKLGMNSAQNRSKSGPAKSGASRHTDTQTDRSGRSGAALGPCSGQPKHRYQSQNLKKLSPKPSLNPAMIPVKEHLRLASVVALSSSGACGAIISLTTHTGCGHDLYGWMN